LTVVARPFTVSLKGMDSPPACSDGGVGIIRQLERGLHP
jgi:hypothetical protein